MFNRPDRSKPKFLGQLDLFHHLQEVTALLVPRYTGRHLPFVKKSEFHLVLQVSMAGRQRVRRAGSPKTASSLRLCQLSC